MNKCLKLLWVVCVLLCICSCSDDDDNIEDIENYIEYKITCTNPNAVLRIEATGIEKYGIHTREEYSYKGTTKEFFAVIRVYCDDPDALISIDLCINGMHKYETSGNTDVLLSKRLKGKKEGYFPYSD